LLRGEGELWVIVHDWSTQLREISWGGKGWKVGKGVATF